MTTQPIGAAPSPAVVDGVDVDAVAAVARACPGVSGLDGGRYGEMATYLPGRTVPGVVVADGRVRVQVRVRWGDPLPAVAAWLTAALTPVTGQRPVDVVVADIDDPPSETQPRMEAAAAIVVIAGPESGPGWAGALPADPEPGWER